MRAASPRERAVLRLETVMKPALPVLVAVALSGAAGGVIGALLVRSDAAPALPDASSSPRVQRLDEQVASVRDEVSRVSGRLRQLELALLAGAGEPQEKVPEPLAEATAPAAGAASGAPAALPAFLAGDDAQVEQALAERVAAVVADLREAEERARDERRAEIRAQMFEDRLARLTEQLGLDAFQQGRMRAALTAEDERRDEIFDGSRDGGWGGLRDAMRALAADTRKELQAFLTPTQLEQYDEQNRSAFGRGRFGPPGFGGGDGPGG